MPRRNRPKNRMGRERGLRPLKSGEKRCPSCLAITPPAAGRPRHQVGCPMVGSI